MDKNVWSIITKMIVSVNRSLEQTGRRPRYSDVLIMRMYLWAVGHDRPMFWACDRRNYDTLFRPRALPSVSQFSRRLRTERIEKMMQAVHERLIQTPTLPTLSFFDFPSANTHVTRRPKKGMRTALFVRATNCTPGRRKMAESHVFECYP